MQLHSKGDTLSQRSLSYTRRNTFQRCNRLYYYTYEERLQPLITPAPLRMGSAYSDALEHADVGKVTEYYTKLVQDQLLSGTHRVLEQLLDEEVVVAALAQTYLDHVALPDVQREVEFQGIVNGQWYDNGRFDGVLQYSDSALTLVENKLKGRFLPADEAALDIDEQITAYVYNASKMFDVDPSRIDVRYEVALKPQLRQKKTETREDFRLRVRDSILSEPSKYHKVFNQRRSQLMLDDFESRFHALARQIEAEQTQQQTDNTAWPQNFHACGDYGGCAMLDICRGRITARELSQHFTIRGERT